MLRSRGKRNKRPAMVRRAALVAVTLTALAMTGAAPAMAASGDSASATRAAAAGAPAVAAQPVYTQGIGLQDAQTHRCLDSNVTGSVYTNHCQFPGNHYQVWEMTEWETSSGQFFFSYRDFATNRCLDSNGSGPGHLYTTNPCQVPGNDYQMWHWVHSGTVNADNVTNLCLDSNDAGQAYTLGCNGGNYQNWWWLQ